MLPFIFSMDKLDYSKNQPSYTLLKKIKINTISNEKIRQKRDYRIGNHCKEY